MMIRRPVKSVTFYDVRGSKPHFEFNIFDVMILNVSQN